MIILRFIFCLIMSFATYVASDAQGYQDLKYALGNLSFKVYPAGARPNIVDFTTAYLNSSETKHTSKTKDAISKSRVGKYKGVDNPFFGKRHTKETKKHLLEKAKERGGIPVVQYTKDGLFIKVWKHATFAGKTLGISPSSISACCLGKRKSIGGYTWKYLHDIK